jgi:uncharacterized membrane protein
MTSASVSDEIWSRRDDQGELSPQTGGILLPVHFNWRVEAHPILAHFPIALLCLAFLFDVIGVLWKSQSFRSAGLYCLVAGAVGSALAVISGRLTPEAREHERDKGFGTLQAHLPAIQRFFSGSRVQVHEHWGYVLLAVVALWLVVRIAVHLDRLRRPGLAVIAGALTLIVLLITGYYGGELVYRERGRGGDAGYVAPPVTHPSPVLTGIERAPRDASTGGLPLFAE